MVRESDSNSKREEKRKRYRDKREPTMTEEVEMTESIREERAEHKKQENVVRSKTGEKNSESVTRERGKKNRRKRRSQYRRKEVRKKERREKGIEGGNEIEDTRMEKIKKN